MRPYCEEENKEVQLPSKSVLHLEWGLKGGLGSSGGKRHAQLHSPDGGGVSPITAL